MTTYDTTSIGSISGGRRKKLGVRCREANILDVHRYIEDGGIQ